MIDLKSESNNNSATSTPAKSLGEVSNSNAELDNLQELAETGLDSLKDVPDVNSEDKYVPGSFSKEAKPLTIIKQILLNLVSHCETKEEDDVTTYVRPRAWIDSDVQKAALLSYSMAAYISTLNKSLIRRIAMQLISDTSLWLSKVFRFFDSLAYFSNDSKEGLIKVVRMVLHSKYPRYTNTGYEALFTRPPVIYYCDTNGQGIGKHILYLCSQLGLPLSCVTSVPCLSSSSDGKFKMDSVALEKYIKDDISATKTPLVVLANAGSSLLGHIDNLQKIYEICLAHNVWFHVYGHSLAALSLIPAPKVPSILGDSISLNLGKWIGLPSLPSITLYKAKDMSHVQGGYGQANHGYLDFLPVWVTLQTLGHENLVQKIRHSFELGDKLLECIEKFPELRILSKKRTAKSTSQPEAANVPVMAMFESLTAVVVFQYATKQSKEKDSSGPNPPYYDNLNSWLVQLLSRQVPNIRTDIINLEEYGVCLRICPLESAHVLATTQDDVEQYFHCLQQQISILNATVLQKEKLYKEHKNLRKLQLVEIANWAGMGGVRYIPEFWADRLNELTDTGKEDINNLNSELVAKLRASDSAFSLGEADDGMLCVRFGMVDDNLDMEELISLVTAAGQELEESSKFLETMSELIKHGIEEANKELIQENNEKLMQEGLLRQVPVIGSLVSWWYPAQSETGIKGRSFNLSSGTIESTENIYKYHMQIKEGSKAPSPNTKVVISSSQNATQSEQNSAEPSAS